MVIVWNKHQGNVPRGAQMVDRSTPYGNPFSHKDGTLARHRVATREEAVASYRKWIWKKEQLQLRIMIRENLRGVDLVCHCVPLDCHAYVVAEIANDPRFTDD